MGRASVRLRVERLGRALRAISRRDLADREWLDAVATELRDLLSAGPRTWATYGWVSIFRFIAGTDTQVRPSERRVLEHVAGHLAAAYRVRRQRGAIDAMLSPSARIELAEATAERALRTLRAAARRAEEARRSRPRPEDALAAWTAVVQGRWTLVEVFEESGRRHFVATENEPRAELAPSLVPTLGRTQLDALVLLARGHSQKAIGYELELSPSHVSRQLSRATRALGVRTRVELSRIARAALGVPNAALSAWNLVGSSVMVTRLRDGAVVWSQPLDASAREPAHTNDADEALAKLTEAELDVCLLAARGLDNAAIAAVRRCAQRTVAVLMARVFRKLAVASRAELFAKHGALMLPAAPAERPKAAARALAQREQGQKGRANRKRRSSVGA